MATHAREPWEICSRGPLISIKTVFGSMGTPNDLLVPVAEMTAGEHAEANARRIVACVNACKGVSTEDLESVPEDFIARSIQVAKSPISLG